MSVSVGSTEDWQPLPLVTDAQTAMAQVLDDLQTTLGPDWEAHPTAPEVAIGEEVGILAAELAQARQRDADLHAAWLGAAMLNLPVILGTAATVDVVVHVSAPGIVIPAALTVVGISDDGLEVAFTTTAPRTAAATTTTATLTAAEVGTQANGVPAGPLRIINTTQGVIDVTATAPAVGGVDPETLNAYLTRLRDYSADLSPGGVRAPDLARLARSIAGVQRCLAIDLLDVTDPTSDPATKPAERTISLFPLDADGAWPTPAVRNALAERIAAVREVNFIIRIGQPTETPVAITFDGVAEDAQNADDVRAQVIAALRTHLDRARWGGTPRSDGSPPTDWTPRRVIRYLDLVRVAGSVDGLAILNTITLNGAATDVTLPGWAPLPAATSTVTGTVA